LFADGIDAFNRVAELVNNIDPYVEWCSLGMIAKHLYSQRIRDDNNYDILSFSKSIELKNPHKKDVTYFVRKEESFRIPIKRVAVDGIEYPYQKTGDYISIKVSIPPGTSRVIEVEYQNELNLLPIEISKTNLRVSLLRKLSDFRDMTFSRNIFGRIFIYYYYNTGFYKSGLKGIAIFLIGLVAVITIVGVYLLKKRTG
jgi:hypothetical protein